MSISDKEEPIRVGCSGFGMAMKKYFADFNVVEVQNTFYDPPQLKTLERWRRDAPRDFRFVIKAWQLITHAASSPTYRRLKHPPAEKQLTDCGLFQDSEVVHDAWRRTLECVWALDADTVLFQCPASFTPSPENQRAMEIFFSKIERPSNIQLYWEPRGEWPQSTILELCKACGLGHTVDPFIAESVTPAHLYFRMHGIGNWKHTYTDSELEDIAKKLSHAKSALVFFNNRTMNSDAERFLNLIGR